jgi:FMN phosphatase YigB (HAD superfamily)
MINTILFDLDGTLLPMDFDRFIKLYFHEIGLYFRDLIEPERLIKSILDATEFMVRNDGSRTNETAFFERFATLIEGDPAIFRERFVAFYDSTFAKTREASFEIPEVIKSFRLLQEKGYCLVLATNAIFPEQAVHHRIRWAGLTPEDFSYIASFEQNHYCKPNPQFFTEVLDGIKKSPGDCLMVGNDAREDLAAGKVGIATFLVTDCLLHRDGGPINSDYQGTFREFLDFVEGLPLLINH